MDILHRCFISHLEDVITKKLKLFVILINKTCFRRIMHLGKRQGLKIVFG